jgi:hypothetical protein
VAAAAAAGAAGKQSPPLFLFFARKLSFIRLNRTIASSIGS